MASNGAKSPAKDTPKRQPGRPRGSVSRPRQPHVQHRNGENYLPLLPTPATASSTAMPSTGHTQPGVRDAGPPGQPLLAQAQVPAQVQQSTQGGQPAMYPPIHAPQIPMPQGIPVPVVQQQVPVYGYAYGPPLAVNQVMDLSMLPPGSVVSPDSIWRPSTNFAYGTMHPVMFTRQGSGDFPPNLPANHPPVRQESWWTRSGSAFSNRQGYYPTNTQAPMADTGDHIHAPRARLYTPPSAFSRDPDVGGPPALPHASRYEDRSHGQRREREPQPLQARKRPCRRDELAESAEADAEDTATPAERAQSVVTAVRNERQENGIEDGHVEEAEDDEEGSDEDVDGSTDYEARASHYTNDRDDDEQGPSQGQGQGPSHGPNHSDQFNGNSEGEHDRDDNSAADDQGPSGQSTQQAPGDDEVPQQDPTPLPQPSSDTSSSSPPGPFSSPSPPLCLLRTSADTQPITTTTPTDLARSYYPTNPLRNPFRPPERRSRYFRSDTSHEFKPGHQRTAEKKWQMSKARYVSGIEGPLERTRGYGWKEVVR